jgi:transcriptional regulator GlxA family with amidase domain
MKSRTRHDAHRSIRYQQIVDRVVASARARMETVIHIGAICRQTGINARTLGRAFRAIHGTSPSGYLTTLRLVEARHALLSADAARETVTQVAMRFGFRELGRFAALYRRAFGESPSATLRRASGDIGDPARRGCAGRVALGQKHSIDRPD